MSRNSKINLVISYLVIIIVYFHINVIVLHNIKNFVSEIIILTISYVMLFIYLFVFKIDKSKCFTNEKTIIFFIIPFFLFYISFINLKGEKLFSFTANESMLILFIVCICLVFFKISDMEIAKLIYIKFHVSDVISDYSEMNIKLVSKSDSLMQTVGSIERFINMFIDENILLTETDISINILIKRVIEDYFTKSQEARTIWVYDSIDHVFSEYRFLNDSEKNYIKTTKKMSLIKRNNRYIYFFPYSDDLFVTIDTNELLVDSKLDTNNISLLINMVICKIYSNY